MCIRRFCFITLLIFSALSDGYSETQNDILQLLSNGEVRLPYVAILPQDGESSNENENLLDEVNVDLTPEIGSLEPPFDQKAYLLYHALRTAEEREQIDPEAAKTFERTKDILRQALRQRCNKLKSCFRKCPKKVYVTCTIECKTTYDDYDVCQTKKKKCYKPKCGRTKPPSWLLRQ